MLAEWLLDETPPAAEIKISEASQFVQPTGRPRPG